MKKKQIVLLFVALILLFIVLAIPSYYKFSQDAKEAEAMTNLNAIKQLMESYLLSNGSYPDNIDLQTLGFSTTTQFRFVYQAKKTKTGFVAETLVDTDSDGNRILYIVTESTEPHIIGTHPDDAKLTLTLGTMADTSD